MTLSRRWLPLNLALLVAAAGCVPVSRSGDGPDAPAAEGRRQSIVLITLSGLRPDAVGALGAEESWTPNIDALAAEADWVGTSVVASSAPVASLVSLMTGLSPWQHQVLNQLQGGPRSELLLLAQALGLAGYRTYSHVPLVYDLGRFGLLRGFEHIADVEPIDRTASLLRDMGDAVPALYWFHLREANVAFVRRDAELPRLADGAAGLPRKITAPQLWPYADPQIPMPDTLRSATHELFLHEVAWADHQVGTLLQAVRDSGQWENSWVIVTATQGIEIGEHDQVLYSQNLGRESIEVPLVIKAPDNRRDSLRAPAVFAVGQTRLWSTLVEAGGGEIAPAQAPSLFRPIALPIVSELYLRNGVSLFSLLDRDVQLVQASRFAPREPAFYLAQFATSGGHPELSEPATAILGRLHRAFNNTRPFSGLSESIPSEWTLERWRADGTERFEDPELAATMADELRRKVRGLTGRERTPTEESALSESAQ